jgi:hypothetical protein
LIQLGITNSGSQPDSEWFIIVQSQLQVIDLCRTEHICARSGCPFRKLIAASCPQVPRGHRPGKTHVRARKRSSASDTDTGSASGSGPEAVSSLRTAGSGAGQGPASGAGQGPAAAGRPGQAQRNPASPAGAVSPRSGGGSEQLSGQGSTTEEAGADAAEAAAAAAAEAAAEAAESQQWADRFGSRDSGGEARDVIRDPVAAVRKWQEALFGADLED